MVESPIAAWSGPDAGPSKPTPTTPRRSAATASPATTTTPMTPPNAEGRASPSPATRLLAPKAMLIRHPSTDSRGSGATTGGSSGRRRKSIESGGAGKGLESVTATQSRGGTGEAAPSSSGGLPNPLSAIGGFIKSYSPVALLSGGSSNDAAASSSSDARGSSPSASPTLGKWKNRSVSQSPKVTISRPLAGAPMNGSTPPAAEPSIKDRGRVLSLSGVDRLPLPGNYFSPEMAGTPSLMATPLTSPDPNANAKDQAGMGFPRRRVVSDGPRAARESDDDGSGIPGIGALLNGLPSLNLNLNWNIGNLLGLGADGAADKDRLSAAAADPRKSVDLRLEEAATGGRTFGDETPMSLTPVGPPRGSADFPRTASTGGTADADSLRAADGAASPAPAALDANKSQSQSGRQKPPLFNLQTTFTSNSSPAALQVSNSNRESSPLPDNTRRGSGSCPLSPALLRAGAQNGFDPLTLHALAREHSETDVLRALRERDERLGALTRVLEEEEPPEPMSAGSGSTSAHGQLRSPFAIVSAREAGEARIRASLDSASTATRPLRPQHGRSVSSQAALKTSPVGAEKVPGKAKQDGIETPKAGSAEKRASAPPTGPAMAPLASARAGTRTPSRKLPPRPSTAPQQVRPKTSVGSLKAESVTAGEAAPTPKKTFLSRFGLGGGKNGSPRRSASMASTVSSSSLGTSAAGGTTLVGSASASSIATAGSPALATASLAGAGGKGTRYIRVKTRNKETKEFKHLFMAQELSTCPPSSATTPPASSTKGGAGLASPALSQMSAKFPNGSSNGHTPHSEDGVSVTSSEADGTHTSHAASAGGGANDARRRAVWALKFSCDGSHIAAGCQDGVVRVWAVLRSDEERQRALLDGLAAGGTTFGEDVPLDHIPAVPTSAGAAAASGTNGGNGTHCPTKKGSSGSHRKLFHMPVFEQKPVREFAGHTADVLDVSWSKNGFLLSSSMDKTVRLWHVSKPECLVVFEHSDFITAVAFHPKDDRFFISGSLDCKLRLWNIVEKRVHSWTELPDLITSVVFTADGKLAAAGTYAGTVLFFECETLKYVTTLHAKSTRGKNAKGRKITAVIPVPGKQQERVLVTSNDSRIRMYNLAEKSMLAKYKGLTNATSQIRASMSDDSKFVISGSEDRHIYIWDSGLDEASSSLWHSKKNQGGMESFVGHSNIVTCAVFAPLQTRCFLSVAGDPVYRDSPQLLGVYETSTAEPAVTPLNHLRWESPEVGRVRNGASSADGAIIVTADDHTGVIRVYRNSSLAAFADHNVNAATPSRRGSAMSSTKHSPVSSRRESTMSVL